MDLPRFSARLVALMAEKQDRRDMEHGLPTTGDQLAEQLLALAPVDAVRDLLGEQWLDPAVDLLDASGSANAAQMLLLLGQINRRMSRLQEASSLVERARQEFQRTGDLNAELAARFEAARIVQDLGQSTTAFKSMQEVVTAIRENLPESAPLRLQAEEVWGTALVNQGRYADALEAFAVPLRIGIEQERDDVAFRGLQSLQQRTLLYAAGQCDDDLLERMRTTRDAWSALADTASRAGSHYNLGSCHFWRGEYRAALPEFTQAVEQYRLHFGDYHPKLASFRSMQHLAALGAGELDGLEAPFTLAVRDAERASGVNSVTAMIARQALSELWSRQGRHAKALESYRQLLRDATESGEVNPSLVITWRSFLAHAEARAGGINAALQSFDQAIADCAVTQQSDAADCLQLQLDRMSFAVDPPDQLVLMAEELCEKIDAVTDERALLRSRCTAVWLDVLDRSGNSARRDELRRQRLGWLDRERIHAYGDEDQAQLLPWVL
ncbi:hypothetical protein [Dokdonella sp.]|uniref:hypothetical protein n=1 Tax=Dokdonella sp. TaxID=2291710 RepID=UPI0035280893